MDERRIGHVLADILHRVSGHSAAPRRSESDLTIRQRELIWEDLERQRNLNGLPHNKFIGIHGGHAGFSDDLNTRIATCTSHPKPVSSLPGPELPPGR